MHKKIALTFLLFSLCVVFALDVPPLTSPVMDTANMMSDSKRAELEEYLLDIDKNSTAQIAVLTIESLEGENLEEYAIRVAREWKLGNKEDSKGVLLLVSKKEKKIRIEVGYGAEGDLTDAKCGLIIRNVIAPYFQNTQYAAGITQGVKAIAKIVAPNSERVAADIEKESEIDPVAVIALLIFFTIYFIIFTGALSTKFRALRWLPWASFFVNNANKPHSANYAHTNFGGTGFSSHSGGFGGGFHGGGGGFGGGGASGGW